MACDKIAVAKVSVAEMTLIQAGAVRAPNNPKLFGLNVDGITVYFIAGPAGAAFINDGQDPLIERERLVKAAGLVGARIEGAVECHRNRPHTHADGVTHFHD